MYKSVWTPFIGETLSLTPDDGNEHHIYAVGVVKDAAIVGHAPRELSRVFFLYKARWKHHCRGDWT